MAEKLSSHSDRLRQWTLRVRVYTIIRSCHTIMLNIYKRLRSWCAEQAMSNWTPSKYCTASCTLGLCHVIQTTAIQLTSSIFHKITSSFDIWIVSDPWISKDIFCAYPNTQCLKTHNESLNGYISFIPTHSAYPEYWQLIT